MERNMIYEKDLSFARISVRVTRAGADYNLLLAGGEKPHIGCCVLAVPRPSLTGDQSISVTSSVINITGHKDEQICRYLAEHMARNKNAVTVCSGGFHMDDITEMQIEAVRKAVAEIAEEMTGELTKQMMEKIQDKEIAEHEK